MKIPAFALLLTALFFNAMANILMKAGAGRIEQGAAAPQMLLSLLKNLPLLGGVVSFALALLFYSLSLSKLELSLCYPVMTGGGLLIITIASVVVYNESMTLDKLAGIALIFIGTLIVFRRTLV